MTLDTVWLEEDESTYLARPRDLVPDPSGGWFVLDAGDPRVLSFSEEGRLRGVIGTEGEGPGEFRTGDALFAVGDTLGVAASNPGVVIFYSGSSGRHLGQVPLPGRVNRAAVRGDTLWVDARSFSERKALLRMAPPYEAGERLVTLPDEYDGSDGGGVGVLAGAFPSASVAVDRGRLLVGYEPLGHLLVTERDGTVTDTIRIPAVRRRGTPPGQLYLSLFTPDLESVCADLEVPLDPEVRPVIGFEGDTLLVLQQSIRPDLGVDTFITRHQLEPDGCESTELPGR